MAKESVYQFRTLLTKAEYDFLVEKYQPNNGNTQTNYYFDTARFTLGAFDIIVRVRKRENTNYELAIRRKKSYTLHELDEDLTDEQFAFLMENGRIPSEKAQNEIADIVRGKKLTMYMSLTTYRQTLRSDFGRFCLDACQYLDQSDFELEYHTFNYDDGLKEFVSFLKENNIEYKKCDTKIKRANAALMDY